MNEEGQPFNILFMGAQNSFIVIPRKHQSFMKKMDIFFPSFVELLGCFIIKDPEVWNWNDKEIVDFCLEQI